LALERWDRERDRVLVMGVINVTPDSFYPGSRAPSVADAVRRANRLVEEGADILDIGGESTRPGSLPVSGEEEMDRVVPVIERLRVSCDAVLSVDTTKAPVARAALDAGAQIVNDTSALRGDALMAAVVAERNARVILMHRQGPPRTMQEAPHYTDVTREVLQFLERQAREATRAGIARERVWIDPGIGFGKRLEHNLRLLQDLDRFAATGHPVVVGVSRKSFLGEILDLPPEERLEATLAAQAIAVALGADVVRVHDVRESRRAADVARRLRRAPEARSLAPRPSDNRTGGAG